MNWIFHKLYHLFLRIKFDWLSACDRRWTEFFTEFIIFARQIWLIICVWSLMNWIFYRLYYLFLRFKFDWLSACDRRWIEFFTEFIAAYQIWLIFCMWSSIDWIFHKMHRCALNLIDFLHVIVDRLNFSQNASLRVKFDWFSACDRR